MSTRSESNDLTEGSACTIPRMKSWLPITKRLGSERDNKRSSTPNGADTVNDRSVCSVHKSDSELLFVNEKEENISRREIPGSAKNVRVSFLVWARGNACCVRDLSH